jgi:pilus assembly protein TadC
MATVVFERLLGRGVSQFVSEELDLAGIKMTANMIIEIAILGSIVSLIAVAFVLAIYMQFNPVFAFFGGVLAGGMIILIIYAAIEFKIEQRKSFVENILPLYLDLTAANVRSGLALTNAMTIVERPEFKKFNDDIKLMGKQLYSGESMERVLTQLTSRYRSQELKRTIRMVLEAERYGGGMTDLLKQISKDLRNEHIIQKEVSGQLFMYMIFIAFAALAAAPVLFAMTSQMIGITLNIWSKISLNSLSSVPSTGISFLKFSTPQITLAGYQDFALASIILITGMCAFIVSAISSGRMIRGMRYLPLFILMGLIVYFIVGLVVGNIFSTIAAGGAG